MIEAVSYEQLEQPTREAGTEDSHAKAPADASPELHALLDAIIQRGIKVKEPTAYKDGLKYILRTCLFNPDHGGTSVAIIEYPNGPKQYSCLHAECKGKKWGDVLRLLEPEAATSKKNGEATGSQLSRIVIPELPDVCKLAEEKVEFIVPGLLVADNLTLICGAPSVGKTHVGLWLADAIAEGREIPGLGRCQQVPVLYLTKENPANYIADIARRLNIKNGPGTNLFIWGDWVEEAPPQPAAPPIRNWVSEAKGVLFIDSLMAFFPGDNENDSAQMRDFTNQGRTLLRKGARGVVILHHPGKAESSKTYRGSSDLAPAIDAGYTLVNHGNGVLDRLHLELWRPRFIEQKRQLLFHYRNGDFVLDERPVTVAVVESITQQLRNLLQQNPGCTKTEFENAAQAKGLTQIKARNFLKDGVALGSIIQEKGPNRRLFHSLAPMVATNSDKIQ